MENDEKKCAACGEASEKDDKCATCTAGESACGTCENGKSDEENKQPSEPDDDTKGLDYLTKLCYAVIDRASVPYGEKRDLLKRYIRSAVCSTRKNCTACPKCWCDTAVRSFPPIRN